MSAIAENRTGGSVTLLIIANLVAIVFAVLEGWSLRELMFIYWAQSVIIGYFNFRRILDLKEYRPNGILRIGMIPEDIDVGKKGMALLFAFHYSIFLYSYLIWLSGVNHPLFVTNWLVFAVCVAVFFCNHQFSYNSYRERDAKRKPDIHTIMLFPYARIVPMHLTIIVGSAMSYESIGVILLFLGLKTAADVIMHIVEHRAWESPTIESIGV